MFAIFSRPRVGLFAALMGLGGFGTSPAYALYENAQWTTLDNGMQLVVIENHRAPVVHARLAFRVGSDDERDDQAGIAHFLEHMMFRGSATLEPGEFDQVMSGIGASHNATTSKELTTYLATFGSQHLETWMRLESDRMAGVMLLPDEVESERGVVITEKLQQFDANPQRLWGIEISRRWQGEMAARPVIGRQELLEQFTPDQLRAFFEDWYKPNNAALILSGDVTMEQALALTEQYFGAFEPGALPDRRPYQGVFNTNEPVYEMVDDRVTQDSGRILFWLPNSDQLGWDEDKAIRMRYAAFILRELISGELRDPLDRALVVDQEVATDVSFGVFIGDETAGASATISPVPSVDVNDALDALAIALPIAIDEALDAQAVERAKRKFVRSTIYTNDSVSGPSGSFANLFANEDPFERNLEFEERVAAVTVEEIQAVIDLFMTSDKSFRAVLRKQPYVATEQSAGE